MQEARQIVVPGEVLGEGTSLIPGAGTYRKDKQIIAARLGLLSKEGNIIKIIPLSGKYLPKTNDVVIGRVEDILISGWRLEINSAYSAMLSLKEATSDFVNKGEDLTKYFNLDDYLVTKIVNVTSQNLVDVTMKGPGLRKLTGGRIIKVNMSKVPRIIGKKGSMVSMIKDTTDCKIVVGQNGRVWVQGEPKQEIIAIHAIQKIESDSHHNGLTDEIKTFLEKETGKKIQVKQDDKA